MFKCSHCYAEVEMPEETTCRVNNLLRGDTKHNWKRLVEPAKVRITRGVRGDTSYVLTGDREDYGY